MALPSDQELLASLLPAWHPQLQDWSASGRLNSAAQESLLLNREPDLIRTLVSPWVAGVFSDLPPIVQLPARDISGAMAAYAISTGTIYLKQDWSRSATTDQAQSRLVQKNERVAMSTTRIELLSMRTKGRRETRPETAGELALETNTGPRIPNTPSRQNTRRWPLSQPALNKQRLVPHTTSSGHPVSTPQAPQNTYEFSPKLNDVSRHKSRRPLYKIAEAQNMH